MRHSVTPRDSIRVMNVILALVLTACHKDPTPVSGATNAPIEEAEPAPAPQPKDLSRSEEAAITALSPRDPEPSCSEIGATLSDPAASFARIAERVTMPPWVGIRACGCLVDHAAEPAAEATLVRWVTSADWAGLGLTAVNLLDRMPEDVAARVAAAALDGPIADRTRAEIGSSSHEKVRALLHE